MRFSFSYVVSAVLILTFSGHGAFGAESVDKDKTVESREPLTSENEAPVYGGRDFDTWVHLLRIDLDDSTRWHAVEAIGVLGRHSRQEEAYDVLSPLIYSQSPAIPQASHHALAALNDKGVELLVKTLADETYPHRESIIIAFGKAGPRASKSVDSLLKIAQGSNAMLRRRAFESLLAIGTPTDRIVQAIEWEVDQNDDPHSVNAIIFGLADASLEYEAKERLLIKWLNGDDRKIAHAAANQLAKIGRSTARVRDSLQTAIRAYASDPLNSGAFPSIGAVGINNELALPLIIEVVEEQELRDPKIRNGQFIRVFVDRVGTLGDQGQPAVSILVRILEARREPGIEQIDADIITSLWELGGAASDALPALETKRTEVTTSDAYRENERAFWIEKLDKTIKRIKNTSESVDPR